MDIKDLTPKERAELFRQLSEEKKAEEIRRKAAYESIRTRFLHDVKERLMRHVQDCKDFKDWLRGEAEAFMTVLSEYGKLKRDEQLGFTVSDEGFKVQMKGSRIKKFDERADVAEKRLVDFLNAWIEKTDGGAKNPMYKLAMSMIQRNEAGDLDYKSISRLYELEEDFNDPEYSEIMSLFRESNTVEGSVICFYFEKRDKYNNWNRIEPSFNRM
ncbi:DUF3164 family protein [Bacteroides fragilis]|jgi:hypothetical protein